MGSSKEFLFFLSKNPGVEFERGRTFVGERGICRDFVLSHTFDIDDDAIMIMVAVMLIMMKMTTNSDKNIYR